MANIWVYIGVIGSGKDYAAQKKQEETGGVIESFSEGVREFTWAFLGWKPRTPEEYEEFKYQLFTIDIGYGELICDGRKFIENVGAKMRSLNVNFWADYAKSKCAKQIADGAKDVIIYDCRFANEAAAMIELAKETGSNIKFIFCDYQSGRREMRNDESELFAQSFVAAGFAHKDDITDEVTIIVECS